MTWRAYVRVRWGVAALVGGAIVAAMGLAFSAAPALAQPQGIFSVFKECPPEVPGVTLCSVDTTTSGRFTIGSSTVPIDKDIVQQGGFTPIGESEVEFSGVAARNGETLSKAELNVPGGLAGLVKCEEISGGGLVESLERNPCKDVFENGATGVTATTELAASAAHPVIFNEANLAKEEGTAVSLPIRVHLSNPLLGDGCYIGSEADPIVLRLTTGATKPPAGVEPLHGAEGTPETLEEDGLLSLRISGNSLVDNTFAVPGAEGCGEVLLVKGFLDSILDAKLGIPNKAGENAAVLNGELRAASAEEVIASEGL